MTMFDGTKKFVIDKPIRLISTFSGYDSQLFSFKYLGADVESWRTCEWAVKSIQALKDAHFGDDDTDYSQGMTDSEVYDYLYNRGISANYNEPMTFEQIKRLGSVKARTVFNNIKATHNLVNIQQVHGNDLGIVDTNKYCYIMTYSFPCQDLSLAGKGAGMEKGSGTRSGMLWEVERILDEIVAVGGELPQVLLMENVPEVIGTKNMPNFVQWRDKLEKIGYKCYWKVLNAKDYGVPQNRERCFMVSILGDYYYEFPQAIPLEHRLKDLLEDEVDEKYYLSDRAINGIQNTKFNCSTLCARDYKDPKLVVEEPKVMLDKDGCIEHQINGVVRVRKFDVDKERLVVLLRNAKKESGLSNKQIAEKLNTPLTEVEHWFRQDNSFAIPNEDIWLELKQVLKIETDEFDESILTFEKKPNVFDMSNRAYDEQGCSPTLTTQNSPNIVTNVPRVIGGIGEKKSNGGTQWYQQDRVYDDNIAISVTTSFNPYYAVQQVGQIYGFSKEKNPQAGRIYDSNGLSPTLDTCTGGNRMPKIIEPRICASRGRNPDNPSSRKSGEQLEQRLELGPEGVSNTLTTVQKDNYVLEPTLNLKQKLCNELIQSGRVQEYDVIRHSYSQQRIDGKMKDIQQNNISPTLDTRCDCLGVVKDYRIRKLTPKECFRLMGVKDEDFEKIAKNQSNASLYHLAGDSICVPVLMAIFGEMLGIDWKEKFSKEEWWKE